MSQGNFRAIRLRHAGLEPEEVVQASLRLIEFTPQIGKLVEKFGNRTLDVRESYGLAEQALLLIYQPNQGYR